MLAAPGIRERIHDDIDMIFDWREVGDGDHCKVGDLEMTFARTDHPPPTLAVRVEGAGRAWGTLRIPVRIGRSKRSAPTSTSRCAGHLHQRIRGDRGSYEWKTSRHDGPRCV